MFFTQNIYFLGSISDAIQNEKLCQMSTLDLEKVNVSKLEKTKESLEIFCFSRGQNIVFVNKMADAGLMSKIVDGQKQFLYSHNSEAALKMFGSDWFQNAKLNYFQAKILAENLSNSENFPELKFKDAVKISKNLQWRSFIEMSDEKLLGWPKIKDKLKKLPPKLARKILLKVWEGFSKNWTSNQDAVLMNLIQGISTAIIRDLNPVWVERATKLYIDAIAKPGFIDTPENVKLTLYSFKRRLVNQTLMDKEVLEKIHRILALDCIDSNISRKLSNYTIRFSHDFANR